MSDGVRETRALMGTAVTIEVLHAGPEARHAVDRAFEWFGAVEDCCSRFDEASESRRLAATRGPVAVSDMLFSVVRFALELARETDGAFDPTIGHVMAARGFDRHYRTGRRVRADVGFGRATYGDVVLDEAARTIELARPLQLDLGAVAKGLAIDLAAQELAPHENFAIDAGGDLYLGGRNAAGAPWSVGIRHPYTAGGLLETIHVTNAAVCTSGNYERVSDGGSAHLIDARAGATASGLASVTVVAPSAMVSDAMATAAFVLGSNRGAELLRRHGLRGVLVTPELERIETNTETHAA